jgi:hypothetical protein
MYIQQAKGRLQLSCDLKDIVMGYKAQICRRGIVRRVVAVKLMPNTTATGDLLSFTPPLTTTQTSAEVLLAR